jgi:hypothetical protein
MTTCQRWRHGRASYRPAGEVIEPRRYEVEQLRDDATPKAFVVTHHYARSYPAARLRVGLFERGELVGVAVYSQPWRHQWAGSLFPEGLEAAAVVELSRFVLLDRVPANGESWFLGQAFRLIRRAGVEGLLSYSDDFPRRSAGGELVFPGHLGTIYQATNGVYVGRARRRTIRVLPDGQVLSDRVISKIRKRERGWEYGVELLRRHGAAAPNGDLRAWLDTWRRRLTRPLRHPGCHRYVWAIDRRLRRHLPDGAPYPKELAA